MSEAADHFNLRPFQNADADAVAQLVTQSVRGHWIYPPERFRESQEPQRRRLVAVRAGEVVATAHLAPFGPGTPQALRLDLAGQPPAFSRLYLALLAQLPSGFTQLLGVCREDFSGQMEFFQRSGFRNAWQSWGAHLDLQRFEPHEFEPLEERLFLQGYEAQRFEGHSATDWDVPHNPTTTCDLMSRPEFEEVLKREEVVFVVRFRERLVAFTRQTPRAGEWSSEFTTTACEHRGKGLATLVKAKALAQAQASGARSAGTGGAVLNIGMLKVNTRLGYQSEPMWITWRRELKDEGVFVLNRF